MLIIKNIDYKLEAINLISKELYNKAAEDEFIEKLLDYGIEASIINNLLNKQNKLYEIVVNKLPEIDDSLKPYLRNPLDNSNSFIGWFYLFAIKNKEDSLNEIVEKFYCNFLSEINDEDYSNIDLKLAIKIINNLKIENEDKLVLIEFFSNAVIIYEDIMRVVNEVASVVEKNYHIIESEINRFYDYLINHNDLVSKINDVLKSDFLKNNNCEVHIMIFAYNSMSIYQNNNNDSLCYIYIGFLFFDICKLKEEYVFEEKQMLISLKAISDPTRFKILKLVKDKPMFAQELAKELGLTSATLNHHIAILMNEGLISFFKNLDKKKIFYELKIDSVKAFINNLERFLL